MLQEPTVESGGTAVLDAIDVDAAMQRLDDLLDLSNVKMKLADTDEGPGLDAEKIEPMEAEYRKFLALQLMHPGAVIVPCKLVDEMWHRHILDTAAYRDDCQAIFGRFLDHFPYFGMRGEEDAQALNDAYADTLWRYRDAFGEPPAETWIYEQTGKWKIDARFDKEGLANRIGVLSSYGSRVSVRELDGVDLTKEALADPLAFLYADPPYLGKGVHLYLDTLQWADHMRLAKLLKEGGRWFLTYDADPRITEVLYEGYRCAEFNMTHSAAVQHIGREYAVFSPGLNLGTLDGLGGPDAAFIAPA